MDPSLVKDLVGGLRPKRNQWRTWSGLLILGAMMLGALALCRDRPNGPELLSSVVTGLGGLGLWLAGKSATEHVAYSKKPDGAP